MKVYVGELPKSCERCKFYECETELVGEWGMEKHRHICKINGSLIQGICPLQSLADYTKQVRKEAVEKIINNIENYRDCVVEDYENPEDTTIYGIFKVILEEIEQTLDQIQGETNG